MGVEERTNDPLMMMIRKYIVESLMGKSSLHAFEGFPHSHENPKYSHHRSHNNA
jgi:hypothetical protein